MNMCFSKEPAPAEIEVSAAGGRGRPAPLSWFSPLPIRAVEVPKRNNQGRAPPAPPTPPACPRLARPEAAASGALPARACPAAALSRPFSPRAREPVTQENVCNPLEPQLCFFLSYFLCNGIGRLPFLCSCQLSSWS